MIVNDAPAFRQALQNKREATMWRVGCSLQGPTTEHNCRVRREHRDFKIRKGECPHLCPVGIFLVVPLADGVPAAPDLVIRNKNSRRRSCVAVHEFVDVAASPCGLLCTKHGLNLRGWIRRILCRSANKGRSPNTRSKSDRVEESFVSSKREYHLQRQRSLIN